MRVPAGIVLSLAFAASATAFPGSSQPRPARPPRIALVGPAARRAVAPAGKTLPALGKTAIPDSDRREWRPQLLSAPKFARSASVLHGLHERAAQAAAPGADLAREIELLYLRPARLGADAPFAGRRMPLPDGVPSPAGRAAPLMASSSLRRALESRDRSVVRNLLQISQTLREQAGESNLTVFDKLELAVFAGRFGEARRHAAALAAAAPSAEDPQHFSSVLRRLEASLPKQDFPAAEIVGRAVEEMLATTTGDPFQIQKRVSSLVGSLGTREIPKAVERFQDRLAMRYSWLARQNAVNRRGRPTGAVQQHKDCWTRSIYDLPIQAMSPLRSSISYPEFLERAAAFTGKDVKKHGLAVEDFPRLAAAMGFKANIHFVDGDGLKALLDRHGAVIAVGGWFDKSAAEVEEWQAWLRYHQHVMIIKSHEGEGEGRRFSAIDSLVDHETSYLMEELGMMRAYFYTLEPAKNFSPAALSRFALGRD